MCIKVNYEDRTGYHSLICDVDTAVPEQAIGDAISEVQETSPEADILETCQID
jgi:hypothetical protein